MKAPFRLLLPLVLLLAHPGRTAELLTANAFDARAIRGAFLLRGIGARPVGMGEAFTAVADDASAGWPVRGGPGVRFGAAGQHLGPAVAGYALPAEGRLGALYESRFADSASIFRLAMDASYPFAAAIPTVAGGCEVVAGSIVALR